MLLLLLAAGGRGGRGGGTTAAAGSGSAALLPGCSLRCWCARAALPRALRCLEEGLVLGVQPRLAAGCALVPMACSLLLHARNSRILPRCAGVVLLRCGSRHLAAETHVQQLRLDTATATRFPAHTFAPSWFLLLPSPPRHPPAIIATAPRPGCSPASFMGVARDRHYRRSVDICHFYMQN